MPRAGTENSGGKQFQCYISCDYDMHNITHTDIACHLNTEVCLYLWSLGKVSLGLFLSILEETKILMYLGQEQ